MSQPRQCSRCKDTEEHDDFCKECGFCAGCCQCPHPESVTVWQKTAEEELMEYDDSLLETTIDWWE